MAEYKIYTGTDKPIYAGGDQIKEDYYGCFCNIEDAENAFFDLCQRYKKKRKHADEHNACVRYFVYILGYNKAGNYVTLRSKDFMTRQYCKNREIVYEEDQ